MAVKILLVDDEPAVAEFLKSILQDIPGVTVIATAHNAYEALSAVRHYKPQVVFLDVDMPHISGLQLAKKLRAEYEKIYLVFATAYPDYALQAFEVYPFDYILKPFNAQRLKKTMHRLCNTIENAANSDENIVVLVDKHGEQRILSINEIAYLESQGHKIRIKTTNSEFTINGDLNTLEMRLKARGFFRSHRSFLVNEKQITTIVPVGYTYDIQLKSGDRVPLSRRQRNQLANRLKSYIKK